MYDKQQPFLTNCWYVVAWDYELLGGKGLARTVLEQPLVVFRGESGKAIALEDRCCHRAAPLSMGRIEGDCIRCMYHGMKYDDTGRCVEVPGQDRIPKSLKVRSYPVEERDRLIWVWMGDPALADPDQIVDYEPLGDPAWAGLPDYLHYDANWLLIVDNLSDFSHLAFVHTHSLGGSEQYAYANEHITVQRQDNGFRVERWHMDSAAPPFHRRVIDDKTARLDRRNIAEMQVPGIFLMETLFTPAGSTETEGWRENAWEYRNCQYMTPETRSTTHFFWNYLHNRNIDDPTIAISLRDSMVEGFNEDKVFIEAQQQRLENDPDFRPRVLEADVALTHFRRVLSKRIESELASAPASIQPSKTASQS